MSMYFADCKTANDLKKRYKLLAKQFHPDNNGDADLFKSMQAEFSQMWEVLKDVHVTSKGEEYRKETSETADEFMQLISILLPLSGVNTELCGSWIWCSGNTRAFKDLFKKLGFRWSRTKNAWYFHKEPFRKYHSREFSLDEIRCMYGSYTPDMQEREKKKRLLPM